MDELAILAERDPLEFRLSIWTIHAHLVARGGNCQWLVSRKDPGTRAGALRGRGIGFARYKGNGSAACAVVIEVEVTDRIALDRIWAVVDVGEVFSPDGLVNQIRGHSAGGELDAQKNHCRGTRTVSPREPGTITRFCALTKRGGH